MIAIKRKCEFFDGCKFADRTSRTCAGGGGGYCGIYRSFKKMQKKLKEENKNGKSN